MREANGAEGAGSGAGLTDVQIGSAVEGEDEGGLACYRYLADCFDSVVMSILSGVSYLCRICVFLKALVGVALGSSAMMGW